MSATKEQRVDSIEHFALRARTLLGQHGHDRPEEHAEHQDWIDRLQIIRTHIASLVIADAVHRGDDWVEPVVELLGNKCLLDNIQALDEKLGVAGLDTDVNVPYRDDPGHVESLGDAACSLGVAWGEAGYLIGLAVGMQLGSGALDRGGR